MDPNNPRWETSDERRKRSATFWKIIVGTVGTAALTAVVVASCLDRDAGARRDVEVTEPAYVETTAATVAPAAAPERAPVPVPRSTSDSTGGIAVNGRAADEKGTTQTTGATIVNAPAATAVNVTPAPPARTQEPSYSPRPAPFETAANADGGAPVAGHAAHAANDPNNRGSNPDGPSMSAGAGRFVTEAPYWGASAFPTNPDAGAGPFQTERNTPAR